MKAMLVAGRTGADLVREKRTRRFLSTAPEA
jgi:hypothetical protein